MNIVDLINQLEEARSLYGDTVEVKALLQDEEMMDEQPVHDISQVRLTYMSQYNRNLYFIIE